MYVKIEKHEINGKEQTILVLCADKGKILHRKHTDGDLMEDCWLIDGATVDDYEEVDKPNREES